MGTNGQTFDPLSKTFHWLSAIIMIGLLVVGDVMSADIWEMDVRRSLYTGHKTFGVLLFFLTLFRLYWHYRNPPPRFPASMPRWQKRIAGSVHGLLYVLALLVPLSGWAMSSAGTHGIQLFGAIPFPTMSFLSALENAGDLRHLFKEIHETLAGIVSLLILIHIGAALMHHFVEKDDVLTRMSPACMTRFLNKIRGR